MSFARLSVAEAGGASMPSPHAHAESSERRRHGVIFYVHGGGFVSCSAATHRPIAAALARLTQRSVLSVDYRLAPEARLPAAHEDVAAAYASVIRPGTPPSEIALAGDSAGGNLVLSLAVQLRDRGAPTPACIVVFSPWTDLTGRSPSVQTNAERCAMFHPENMDDFAAIALGNERPDNPVVSPAYADLHDLPPVLLHVGSTELLLDDARRVHERIRRAMVSPRSVSLRMCRTVGRCCFHLSPKRSRRCGKPPGSSTLPWTALVTRAVVPNERCS